MNENNEDSAVIEVSRGGRPTKYDPETIDRLLAATADGLTQKQACLATGICENTLTNWREQHADLESRLEQAREQARQKSLSAIKSAGEKDWRAHEAFLKLSFQADYRQGGPNINVTASAQAATATICTEEQRKRLIDVRESIGANRGAPPLNSVTRPELTHATQ